MVLHVVQAFAYLSTARHGDCQRSPRTTTRLKSPGITSPTRRASTWNYYVPAHRCRKKDSRRLLTCLQFGGLCARPLFVVFRTPLRSRCCTTVFRTWSCALRCALRGGDVRDAVDTDLGGGDLQVTVVDRSAIFRGRMNGMRRVCFEPLSGAPDLVAAQISETAYGGLYVQRGD